MEHLRTVKFWSIDQRILRLYSSSVLIIYEGDEGGGGVNVENASDFLKNNKMLNSYCLTHQSLKTDFGNQETAVANPETEEESDLTQNLSMEVNGLKESQETQDSCIVTSSKPQQPKVSVHLVDFAHAYIARYTDPDENYIDGLCNLIDYLEEIIKTR